MTSSVCISGSSIYISYEGKSFTAIRYRHISNDPSNPPPPAPKEAVEVAFQANTSDLWTTGTAGTKNWKLGMMESTSPAIAADTKGNYEVAFQANTGNLWTATSGGGGEDHHLGMMDGTNPSIPAGRRRLPGRLPGQHRQSLDDGDAGTHDLHLGMMRGTSPGITALVDGGYEIAFQANTGDLWTAGTAGDQDWKLGMMAGTSPAIAGLSDGSYEVAFEANTTSLWVVTSAGGGGDQHLGMISARARHHRAPEHGWEVAFQANTTSLWTTGTGGTRGLVARDDEGLEPEHHRAARGGGYQVELRGEHDEPLDRQEHRRRRRPAARDDERHEPVGELSCTLPVRAGALVHAIAFEPTQDGEGRIVDGLALGKGLVELRVVRVRALHASVTQPIFRLLPGDHRRARERARATFLLRRAALR